MIHSGARAATVIEDEVTIYQPNRGGDTFAPGWDSGMAATPPPSPDGERQ